MCCYRYRELKRNLTGAGRYGAEVLDEHGEDEERGEEGHLVVAEDVERGGGGGRRLARRIPTVVTTTGRRDGVHLCE